MEELKKILEELRPDLEVDGREDLIDSGELDSFDVISLVGEIMDKFQISVPVEAIVPENFNSVERMYSMIVKLKEDGI